MYILETTTSFPYTTVLCDTDTSRVLGSHPEIVGKIAILPKWKSMWTTLEISGARKFFPDSRVETRTYFRVLSRNVDTFPRSGSFPGICSSSRSKPRHFSRFRVGTNFSEFLHSRNPETLPSSKILLKSSAS